MSNKSILHVYTVAKESSQHLGELASLVMEYSIASTKEVPRRRPFIASDNKSDTTKRHQVDKDPSSTY